MHDNIQKQALILPPDAVGTEIGGQPIIAQGPTGVVFVPVATNPVLVRANYDNARIWGIEHTGEVKLSNTLTLNTVFTYLHAEDTATGLPPNIEGGTPAPDGYLMLRYLAPGERWWVQGYLHAAGEQTRLSSLDLEDRRTGATRTRSSIRSFFYNGATARGWVSPGRDGVAGTADDLLDVTGETLAQIQDRVLGPGVTSAPLFNDVMGAIGELGAAKGIGIYWPSFVGVGKESPDLLPDIQVRTICEVHKRLIIREGDSPVHRYVLAVMEGPNEIRLRGWIRGDEAFVVGKLEAPNNRTPAHFVPNEKLHPISTLDVNNEPATTLPDLSPTAET